MMRVGSLRAWPPNFFAPSLPRSPCCMSLTTSATTSQAWEARRWSSVGSSRFFSSATSGPLSVGEAGQAKALAGRLVAADLQQAVLAQLPRQVVDDLLGGDLVLLVAALVGQHQRVEQRLRGQELLIEQRP